VGRRLATKILNASRFVLGLATPESGRGPTEPVDLSILAQLNDVIVDATRAFEGYDYTRALDKTESFLWFFCDNYLELVKDRAYNKDNSALATLRTCLDVLLRLFAPFFPFVTEEIWSWWKEGSIHRTKWPSTDELDSYRGNARLIDLASSVLSEI